MPDRPTPASTRLGDVPAREIRLADGGLWGFSTPTVLLTPRVETTPDAFGRPVERIVVDASHGYPLSIRYLLDGVKTACEGGPVARQYEAFFALAASLLRRAHDLDAPTACALLAVPETDLVRLVGEVMAAASDPGPRPDDEPPGDILT